MTISQISYENNKESQLKKSPQTRIWTAVQPYLVLVSWTCLVHAICKSNDMVSFLRINNTSPHIYLIDLVINSYTMLVKWFLFLNLIEK